MFGRGLRNVPKTSVELLWVVLVLWRCAVLRRFAARLLSLTDLLIADCDLCLFLDRGYYSVISIDLESTSNPNDISSTVTLACAFHLFSQFTRARQLLWLSP